MSFIFSILLLLLFIGLFVFIAVLGFLRSIFSFGKHKNPMQNNRSQNVEQPAGKPKIFDKKEGEYVDFEEVD
jgi:hypothetical protein